MSKGQRFGLFGALTALVAVGMAAYALTQQREPLSGDLEAQGDCTNCTLRHAKTPGSQEEDRALLRELLDSLEDAPQDPTAE
ncbi:MAG: hypothetical protein AAF530_19445 [Pseudomonadota bacterium]